MEDLISVSDAARLLEATPDAVYQLIKRGKITSTGTRRLMRVSRTQVLAWKNRGANLQAIIDNPQGYKIEPSTEEKQRLVERINQVDREIEEKIIQRLEQRRQREIDRLERFLIPA